MTRERRERTEKGTRKMEKKKDEGAKMKDEKG